jgi:hypothetical protein
MVLGLIPRLVLDEDEVSKIIHDACDNEIEASFHKTKTSIDEHDKNDGDEDLGSVGTESSASIPKKISVPGFVADPKRLVDKVRKIIVNLRESLWAAPNIITHIILELPARAGGFAENIPSILAELHTTIITWTLNGTNAITISILNALNIVKDLPHRATFQWRHLLGVLAVMILCPLLGEVVFFLPMNPVDHGPDENQVFIYGIMTLYQFFMQLPWVETCNFAMPQVNIPIRARLVALFVGLTIAKLIDLVLTIGIFTYEPVFPIPFSILITGTLGTLPTVPILYFMTPRTDRQLGNFSLMFTLLVAYWVALLVVIGWAIGIQRLQGKSLQYLVLFSYAALRFVCKVLLCANISTRLQPKRHIQLNLVVDVIFTRVQVATWPFIDSPFTLMALFASEFSVILWRYYDGVDRIQLWWDAILTTASLDHSQDNISKRRRMKGITEACFTKSNQYIINMSLSGDKEDVVRNLTTCKTSSTLGNSSSKTTTVIAKNQGQDQDQDQHQNQIDFCGNEGAFLELPCKFTARMQDGNILIESSSTTNNVIVLFDDDDDSPTHDTTYLGTADGRSNDLESASFDDDVEDDNSGIELVMGRNRLADILRRPIDDGTANNVDVENGKTDKLIDIELRDQSPPSSPTSTEETWEQRDLYHMVDSTGSLCVNIIVRINQQLIFVAVRNLPSSEHLNESFQISDDRWREAQIYGSVYIALMLLLVIGINFSSVFFSKKQGLEGKKLSLGRVLSYLFKENFWYFFFWLISTGALVSSAMVNHFGADFSMNFNYLSCLHEIEWPGCPSD